MRSCGMKGTVSAAPVVNRRRFTQALGMLGVARLCPRGVMAQNATTADRSRELQGAGLAVSAILERHAGANLQLSRISRKGVAAAVDDH